MMFHLYFSKIFSRTNNFRFPWPIVFFLCVPAALGLVPAKDLLKMETIFAGPKMRLQKINFEMVFPACVVENMRFEWKSSNCIETKILWSKIFLRLKYFFHFSTRTNSKTFFDILFLPNQYFLFIFDFFLLPLRPICFFRLPRYGSPWDRHERRFFCFHGIPRYNHRTWEKKTEKDTNSPTVILDKLKIYSIKRSFYVFLFLLSWYTFPVFFWFTNKFCIPFFQVFWIQISKFVAWVLIFCNFSAELNQTGLHWSSNGRIAKQGIDFL